MLKPKEVAERLRVNEQTVRRWIRDGQLKAVRAGRVYRVPEHELERFIERRGEK